MEYCVERAGRVAGDDVSIQSNRGAPRRDQSGINWKSLSLPKKETLVRLWSKTPPQVVLLYHSVAYHIIS
jgi:hypothetical protein